MRTMNFVMSLITLTGMLGIVFGGSMFAELARAAGGDLAADLAVIAGLFLIAANGVIGGRCFAAAAFGTDADQYIA